MGNCQAAEAAAAVIQHPGGKVQRLYWPTSAADVMRSNPGHYVALVILRVSGGAKAGDGGGEAAAGGARITRVKLLKPKDTLLLGQVYRLITSQEVTKALRARKHEKMKKCELSKQSREQFGDGAAEEERESSSQSSDQEAKRERDRHRSCGAQSASGGRARQWRPSLQSISESTG